MAGRMEWKVLQASFWLLLPFGFTGRIAALTDALAFAGLVVLLLPFLGIAVFGFRIANMHATRVKAMQTPGECIAVDGATPQSRMAA